MTKKLLKPNRLIKAIIACATLLLGAGQVKAQQITLFRTKVIVLPYFSTLSSALAAAVDGDSLVMSPHTFKESNLTINKDIAITGTSDTTGSTTIDAEMKSRVLLINSGDVKLTDLHFVNGKVVNGAGGGICNYGSGDLIITGNSSISNSSCTGIYALGGGVFSGGKLFILGNTTIHKNYAEEDGGGAYAYSTFDMADNASVMDNKADGSGGGVFSVPNGALTITDFAKIENNTAMVAGGGVYGVGTIARHASVSGNKAEFGGGIAAFNDGLFLQDTAQVNNNIATTSGAGIWLNNCAITASGSFQIMNNKIPAVTGTLNFGGAIYNVNGTMLINGGTITGNQSPIAAIYNTSGTIGRGVTINATHIYNPNPDGTRKPEIFNSPSLPTSIINFQSDSCWWGSNDTTGLIANKAGTSSGIINSYVMITWLLNNGLPVPPLASGFPLSADFRMNDGSKMDSLRLRTIRGHFTTANGSFSPAIASIDTDNYVRSLYIAPALSDSISVMAYVDGDTFRSAKIYVIGLDIKPNTIQSNIKIYPNPASEQLYIDNATMGSELALYNIEGRMISHTIIKNNTEQISLSGLTNGIYIIQITDPSGQKVSAKILKQ